MNTVSSTDDGSGGGMDEDIIKRRGQAEAFFRRKHPRESPEQVADFGSYCVEQWLKGRDPRTAFVYLAVDFFRSPDGIGRASRGSDITKRRSRAADPEEGPSILESLVDPGEPPGSPSSLAVVHRAISGQERAIWLLAYQYGFTLKEIGLLFGVTESRISQRLARIQEGVLRNLSASEKAPGQESSCHRESFDERAFEVSGDICWAEEIDLGDFLFE